VILLFNAKYFSFSTHKPYRVMEKKETTSEGTGRLQAFSDGIFAIAITLLVLDIHVPDVKGNQSLLNAVLHNWEPMLAFMIGFFTLLVCWINHHYMFEVICKSNGMLLLLNGFKLLVVSFTPFATALLSKYIGTPNQATAISIYGLNFFLMGTAMTGIWLYAIQHDLTNAPREELRAATELYVFASLLSGSIFILSFVNTIVSLVLFGLMFMIFVFPRNMIVTIEKRGLAPLNLKGILAGRIVRVNDQE
jgi:uncharacterized membrane protein